MTYTPTVWVDETGVGDGTVLTAARLNNMESGIASAANTGPGTLEAWHTVGAAGEPAFQNAWVNYGGGEQVAQFRRDPFGKVQVRGLVKNGTANTAIFTLPVGYRPPVLERFPVMAYNGVLGYGFVEATGGVAYNGSAVWGALDAIEFDTDTVTTYMVGPAGPVGPVGPPGAGLSAYEGAVQPGILAATDCATGLVIVNHFTVAAGVAYVLSAGGVLVRTTPTLTTITVPACAAAGTYRLDQVVVDTLGVVSRLAGTAESAAVTLANRTGAATVPPGYQRLHDALANGDGIGPTLRDRRPWARGAFARILRTSNAAGGIDYTTSATANTWIDATNLALRIECSGKPIRVKLIGSAQNNVAGAATVWNLLIDNVSPDGAVDGLYSIESAANYTLPFAHEWVTTPTVGSHLIQPSWRVSSGTALILCRATWPLTFYVEEITRENANNGTS